MLLESIQKKENWRSYINQFRMAAVKNLFSYTEKILHLDNTNYAKIVHNKVAGKPKLKGKLITNEHIRRCVNETPCSKVFYGYFATNILNFADFFSLSI